MLILGTSHRIVKNAASRPQVVTLASLENLSQQVSGRQRNLLPGAGPSPPAHSRRQLPPPLSQPRGATTAKKTRGYPACAARDGDVAEVSSAAGWPAGRPTRTQLPECSSLPTASSRRPARCRTSPATATVRPHGGAPLRRGAASVSLPSRSRQQPIGCQTRQSHFPRWAGLGGARVPVPPNARALRTCGRPTEESLLLGVGWSSPRWAANALPGAS